ncbi:hypothetical protein [Kluyvera sichuanensis]|uniref:hypothetical protein n=1 Tax=Kluyvera sichuanensis TaxID=2725494 RepID=UPI002FD2C601
MKSIKCIAVLGLTLGVVILSGCAKNQQAIPDLKSHGFVEVYDKTVAPGEDGKTLVCNNKNDESFSFEFITEKELNQSWIGYIPILNLAAPALPKHDTKFQHITYNSDLTENTHYGIIPIDGKNVDVYIDESGFTKNMGAFTYVYRDDNNHMRAFKTETGIIPHLENFYDCHYQGQS